MNKSDFGKMAVGHGWTRHSGIDACFSKRLGLQTAQILPSVNRVPTGIAIDLGESCVTEEMKNAMDFVAGETTWPGILSRRRPPTRITRPEFVETDIVSLLNGVLQWLPTVNRTEALERYANYVTDAAPGGIVSHLIAHVLLDRREVVEHYYETFDDGNPFNFVPYVTKDMIGRALELER